MFPADWHQFIDAALRSVERYVNEELGRQYQQLVDSLHAFLDDLFNYPLVDDWRKSLAGFAEHWEDRGLKLTDRTIAAIERLIERRIGGSLAMAMAEAPAISPVAANGASDASPSAARASATKRDPATPERGLLGFQFAARRLADEEQRLLWLSDLERREFEQFVFESLRAKANGTPPPLPPLGWWEKKGEWLKRQESQPGMRGVTREEQDRSILQWKYDNLDKLPPEERNRLHFQRLMEQRREYAAKYGLLAAFLNPGFDGTGTMNDWGGGMSGFLQATGGSQPSALGFPSRGPRRGGQNRTPTQGGGLGGKQPKKRDPKPRFPVPKDRDPAPKDPQTGKPIPEHERAALAEKEKAKFIHSLPNEVVIYWGEKIGTHGADVVSYNLRTKQVTLWDVKYRSASRTIRPSTTFAKDSGPLANAIRKARDGIRDSRLSPADKEAALNSLKAIFETRTIGAGKAKNSTLGDHK
jgi:hypothetical protein